MRLEVGAARAEKREAAELAQRVDKRWRARLASGDPLEASLQRERVRPWRLFRVRTRVSDVKLQDLLEASLQRERVARNAAAVLQYVPV